MDSIGHYLYNSDSSDDESDLNFQRRNIRAKSNIFLLNETEFKQLFRLNKEAFNYVFHQIEGKFKTTTSAGIPAHIKFAATLRFLAQGSYQKSVGQDFHLGLSQQSTSNAIAETLSIMEDNLCEKWITMKMTEPEKAEIKREFYKKSGIPGVIGCVDGSQIKIIRPAQMEHIYYCRKGYHAINAMFICDDRLRIRAVDATHGGSCHDSLIWNLSADRAYLLEQWNSDKNSWLLGDSGYPLEPWLMTPYRAATENSAESRFNTAHSQTRNVVERCIGVLKTRFRCLLAARELHYTPKKVSQIINVCSMLHNVLIHFCVDFDEVEEDVPDSNDSTDQTPTSLDNTHQSEARRIRNQITIPFV